MDAKYYVPSIENFKVGFRYEKADYVFFPNIQEWEKQVFSAADDQMTLGTIETLIKHECIRCKCLDESDIIEAGWKIDESQNHDYFISDDTFMDCFGFNDRRWDVKITKYGWDNIFQGFIRNYNDLIDVMRMLDIKK